MNVYLVYEITNFYSIDSYPALTNALFGAVKLTKTPTLTNTDILIMELDFIDMDFFHILVEEMEKM